MIKNNQFCLKLKSLPDNCTCKSDLVSTPKDFRYYKEKRKHMDCFQCEEQEEMFIACCHHIFISSWDEYILCNTKAIYYFKIILYHKHILKVMAKECAANVLLSTFELAHRQIVHFYSNNWSQKVRKKVKLEKISKYNFNSIYLGYVYKKGCNTYFWVLLFICPCILYDQKLTLDRHNHLGFFHKLLPQIWKHTNV